MNKLRALSLMLAFAASQNAFGYYLSSGDSKHYSITRDSVRFLVNTIINDTFNYSYLNPADQSSLDTFKNSLMNVNFASYRSYNKWHTAVQIMDESYNKICQFAIDMARKEIGRRNLKFHDYTNEGAAFRVGELIRYDLETLCNVKYLNTIDVNDFWWTAPSINISSGELFSYLGTNLEIRVQQKINTMAKYSAPAMQPIVSQAAAVAVWAAPKADDKPLFAPKEEVWDGKK